MQTTLDRDAEHLMTVRQFAESDVWKKYHLYTGSGIRAVYKAIEAGWLGVYRFNARVIRIDPKRAEQDIKAKFLSVPKLSSKMQGKLIFC